MASDYKFISTDPEEILTECVAKYEELTGVTVQPASPERLFIDWVVNVVVQERVLTNYAANQNIPSRAEGENLDALAELFYSQTRPTSSAAVCTMQFNISEAQGTAILIPAGTRITDTGNTLVWETLEDVYVPAGSVSVTTTAQCQTVGAVGNNYAAGQISKLVDVYQYYSTCQNITESGGGSDTATDTELYNILRQSEDAWSDAGAYGAYAYFAKSVSTEIADVCPNSPEPGVVYIYALMEDGTPANEETKNLILEACSDSTVRPFTDYVQTADPETVEYDIDLTYYLQEDAQISASSIEESVGSVVDEYIAWQCAKLGRDINPSKLYHMIMGIDGIKRVEVRSPVFTRLRDGKLAIHVSDLALGDTVPQYAAIGTSTVLNGGYEDE